MKNVVGKILSRIDAATLRERVLLFLAAAVVLVASVDSVSVSPAVEKARKVRAAIAGTQTELDTIENTIRTTVNARGVDPDAPARARYQELAGLLARLDAQILQEQERFTSPERMRDVLKETLQATGGVQLIQLKSLPAESIAETVPGLAGAKGEERTRIFRHGIELTVSGSYADLYAYLRYLEKRPRMYWGKAVLAVEGYPRSTLTLTVYTLSLQKVWIQI